MEYQLSKQYYVEFYDKNDELFDCTTEYGSKNAAIVAAEFLDLDFKYGLLVEKNCIGRLNWNLSFEQTKRKR